MRYRIPLKLIWYMRKKASCSFVIPNPKIGKKIILLPEDSDSDRLIKFIIIKKYETELSYLCKRNKPVFLMFVATKLQGTNFI